MRNLLFIILGIFIVCCKYNNKNNKENLDGIKNIELYFICYNYRKEYKLGRNNLLL